MAALTDISNGSLISFRSKAVNDNNFYYGKVVGRVESLIAQTYTDIFTDNSAVQSADPDVPAVELQTFLLIRLLEPIDNTDRYIIPFSEEWISLPSLNIISSTNVTLIKVFNANAANSQNIIDVLKAAGFSAKVDSYL